MFIGLLAVTLLVALGVSTVITLLFVHPVRRIMDRIVPDEISGAWVRYLIFAIYVVGVAGGARISQLERYVTPRGPDAQILELSGDRWVVEVYATILGSAGAIAWLLLVFFAFALVAYVVVRAMELRQEEGPDRRWDRSRPPKEAG